MSHAKTFLLIIIALLAIGLVASRFLGVATGPVAPTPPPGPRPFAGLPIRFDGHYREQRNEAVYLMRFFPEGRIVMINGTTEVDSTLPGFLIRETKGNPAIGLYNVAPRVTGDSIHFTTYPEKGEIDYAGAAVDSVSVRFKRYSHITGARQLMEYEFRADTPASEQ